MSNESKCPFAAQHGARTTASMQSNADWWPKQLNIGILHQHSAKSNPLGADFNYAEEFRKLDLAALKKDLTALMTDSQDWWPADWGHYGGLFIRMAWHSAGTYRISDGRGGAGTGNQRFAPVNSWPDNVNLDKARRLLWPIKQKYGNRISWADLYILAGNVALESMGFKTFGFAGGRVDIWEPEEDIYWGGEAEWLGDKRYSGERELENPLAAVQMGLIYVNPEGPNGQPDVLASGRDIRETFRRMAMDDEETVALVAGGHTFGKCHGAGDPKLVGAEPEAAPLEQMGLGWKNAFGTGKRWRHHQQRHRRRLDAEPDAMGQRLLRHAVRLRLEPGQEPLRRLAVGAGQRRRQGPRAGRARSFEEGHHHHDHGRPRAAHGPDLRPDLAPLPQGPASLRRRLRARLVQADPPRPRPALALPRRRGAAGSAGLAGPGARRRPSADRREGYRRAEGEDPRHGPVGLRTGGYRLGFRVHFPRLRQARRRQRRAHPPRAAEGLGSQPARASSPRCWPRSKACRKHSTRAARKISLADLIVLGGCAAVEQAAKAGGHAVTVPFTPGRTDATQEQTDVVSFAVLEPVADGFRNYLKATGVRAEERLLDKAQLLTLTAPEMTVLVGGLRALGISQASHGIFTAKPGVLSNDFFANVLDMGTVWVPTSEAAETFEGRDRATGKAKWTATRVDLVFGSNSQLRALAEVYAQADAKEKFVRDFVAAWNKVMNLDRFDLA
jgi:catalase-peroxidase